MGFKEKALAIKAKRVETMREAVGPVLEPGEQVALSALGSTGPGLLVGVLFFGPIGMMLFTKNYFVYLTDRRMIFLRASLSAKAAKGLAFAYPREDVSVVSVGKSAGYTDVRFRMPDGQLRKFHFGRAKEGWGTGFDEEANAIAAALGWTTTSA